jgi:beta-mannosidase
MDHHNKDEPKNKGDNLMLTVTGLPNDLDEFVDYSMITQAEGLKFAIEHFRRRKPHCSGTLFWQLNDCWPALSWSVLDYYGFGKAGYYYARRAYSPVLASFKHLSDGAMELWITNDTLSGITDFITARLGTFAGERVWEESSEIEVGPNESRPVRSWTGAELVGGDDRYLWVLSSNGFFAPNRQFFAAIKDLRRRPVGPGAEVVPDGDHRLSVRLRAGQYAYFVHLSVPDETARYTDNYFDMEPGTERTVVVENRDKRLSPETLELGWR